MKPGMARLMRLGICGMRISSDYVASVAESEWWRKHFQFFMAPASDSISPGARTKYLPAITISRTLLNALL
jgi:hypothetical protein